MSSDVNAAVVRRYVEGIWNQGLFDVAGDLIAPDHVRHDPLLENDIVGIDAVLNQVSALRTALPDLHFEALIYPGEDEFVTRRWTMTGTHRGEWMGFAPTGTKIVNTGMALSRFEVGKIAEEWIQRDDIGLLRQLEERQGVS
jgi:steroid delta-isomerase-like uncharacterized protein